MDYNQKEAVKLVYKSPYFFLVVFFVVYEFFFDHSVLKHSSHISKIILDICEARCILILNTFITYRVK